ncbi:MAG: tRNA (N6-isopentenyl adenosine(37)-C2)-methylthiotransferase MiaB, partial [Coriobacteriaceae bacterium]|nr:tRNA (N6-isopentenyl adenosine(37)-C2)-methylthiotransferase MiaB [Coriobacteriaceae bacterium]
LALSEKAAFSKIHAFRFSARPDTPAASMPDQIAPEVIRERSERLRVFAERLRRADAARRVGTVEPVLIEQIDEAGNACGTTASHHEVVIPAGEHGFEGPSLVQVLIARVGDNGVLSGSLHSQSDLG